MLKVCLVDANDRTAAVYRDIPMSVVSGWLKWEMGRKGIEPCSAHEADVVFLVHAGALDWFPKCRAELKRRHIEPIAARRAGSPYVIAGGQGRRRPNSGGCGGSWSAGRNRPRLAGARPRSTAPGWGAESWLA